MNDKKIDYIEEMLFKYVDEFKVLLLPEQWANVFLECSKNEILTLILLYQKKEVNMTEIAEYIMAPLNTATGVVSRLEKKELVMRMRDVTDKRIVKIRATEKGRAYFEAEKTLLVGYFEKFVEMLTKEEEEAIYSCMLKLLKLLKSQTTEKVNESPPKKIKRITIE